LRATTVGWLSGGLSAARPYQERRDDHEVVDEHRRRDEQCEAAWARQRFVPRPRDADLPPKKMSEMPIPPYNYEVSATPLL
jgi:hypothetical protein